MIVGLVADNLVARFSYGSLRFSRLARHPTAIWSMRFHPATSSCRTASGSRGSRHSLDWWPRYDASCFEGVEKYETASFARTNREKVVVFGDWEERTQIVERRDLRWNVVIHLHVGFLWGNFFCENACGRRMRRGSFFFFFWRKLEKIINKIHSAD